MQRTARLVVPIYIYHITQRGNQRQNIFQDDEDRLRYLSWIPVCRQAGMSTARNIIYHWFAYCLMDNYVHFIAIPRKEESLAKVFSITHMRYSQYFNNNKKKNTSGHLWQGRFYSCVLDKPHLLVALRYMEKNPVRAGIVEKAWQWKWSSATAHINRSTGTI